MLESLEYRQVPLDDICCKVVLIFLFKKLKMHASIMTFNMCYAIVTFDIK